MAFRSTFTLMGDTVNVAARLMAAAPPGAIYATAPVLDRSRTTFGTSPLAPLHVKGKSAPIQAFAVGSETGDRYDADHGALPFAGRTDELDVLDRHLQALTSGEGGALVVEGDAGVGKSRLVAEAVARHPALVVSTVRGEPYGTTFPYRALRDAVRRAGAGRSRGSRGDDPTARPASPLAGPERSLLSRRSSVRSPTSPCPPLPRSTRSNPASAGTAWPRRASG